MSRWWRAYDEALDDPKLQCLSDECFRFWFNLCCVCSENGGNFPSEEHMAFKLRMQRRKVSRLFGELVAAGLIDQDNQGSRPHNWNGRQYKSDVSTERVKRFRNGKRNVSVTPPETENRIQKERKEDAPDGASSKYFFESGCIRLIERDFRRWEQSFTHLELRAELIGLSKWAGEQKDWFHAVSGALAKRNREIPEARKRPARPLTPAEEAFQRGVV